MRIIEVVPMSVAQSFGVVAIAHVGVSLGGRQGAVSYFSLMHLVELLHKLPRKHPLTQFMRNQANHEAL